MWGGGGLKKEGGMGHGGLQGEPGCGGIGGVSGLLANPPDIRDAGDKARANTGSLGSLEYNRTVRVEWRQDHAEKPNWQAKYVLP